MMYNMTMNLNTRAGKRAFQKAFLRKAGPNFEAVKQLMDTLQKLGLSEIEADGKFDPNLHNAVMQEKVEGKESGEILAVFLKGYRVGDKIIRHTMVKVAE